MFCVLYKLMQDLKNRSVTQLMTVPKGVINVAKVTLT